MILISGVAELRGECFGFVPLGTRPADPCGCFS